jgi:20S proteasome alpha/beta subunit
MTIAAAFPCKDGLILCADTQETIPGFVKTDTEKMHTIVRDTYSLVFTGAGDGPLVEMTIQEMRDALLRDNPHGEWEIRKTLKTALLDVFNNQIAPDSALLPQQRPDLLIGLQYEAATLLYRAVGTTLYRVYSPECVGSGIILAKSLTAKLFSHDMTLVSASLVAVYILRQAKRWVDGCGGNSDILLLSDWDRRITRIPTSKVEELEKHFDDFDLRVLPVFLAAADATVTHQDYEKIMHQFAMDILALRGSFMDMNEFFRSLYQLAGIPMPKELEELDNGEQG